MARRRRRRRSVATLRGLPGDHERRVRFNLRTAAKEIRDTKKHLSSGDCRAAALSARNAVFDSGIAWSQALDVGSKPLRKAAAKIVLSANKVYRKLTGVCIRD